MPEYAQAEWLLSVTTPLGADVLLLVGVRGSEAISTLFRFEFDLMAENQQTVAFDKLLGQKVTGTLQPSGDAPRYFSGIVSRFTQGTRDHTFTSYSMEVVPDIWVLTLRSQSRIFQNMNVPDILKKVFAGLPVQFEISGTFEPREYCVQYRESDFDFASRLMEEEGIYYYFTHSASGGQCVVTDAPVSHPQMSPSTVIYEEISGGNRPEDRIFNWAKSQQLGSGKATLWDHSFELPGKNLEAQKSIVETLTAGTVSHKLKVANNDALEVYDYPGGYANRFDGVDKGGGDRASDLQKIFQDNARTVGIRMQQEAVQSVVIRGASTCGWFLPGHRFTLSRHFDADGEYLMTSVEHRVAMNGYRSGKNEATLEYENTFHCIPNALVFRPRRVTPIPSVKGTQIAVVTGPPGEEIWTDKYGRIKVQFPWDREGKNNGDSSCWLRVVTPWAGKQWGMIHIPRVGQEVVVDFEDGNIDAPIVVGSVYNAEMMPPYTLPANKTQSGIKSRSSLQGSTANFNEIRFEDKKGSEQVFIHAEKDQLIEVENDETHTVGHDRKKTVTNDETNEIKHDRTEKVGNNETITVQNNRAVTITQGNDSLTIKMGNLTTEVKMGNISTKVDLGKVEEEAMQSIELKVGSSSVKLDQTGVTIKGMNINIQGTINCAMKAPMTQVNGDGILTLKGGLTMIN